jgi:hypothetical protein
VGNEGEVRPSRGTRLLWGISLGYTLLCAAVLAILLVRAGHRPLQPRPGGVRIVTQADLDRLTSAYDRLSKAEDFGDPIYIRTGVFIESIEFLGPYNVRAYGYVWQHYPDSVPPGVARGVIFPEAEKQEFREAYRVRRDDGELVGWSYSVNLRQEFDYACYPFDGQEFWLRLWPVDFESNVLLVPDLPSYQSWEPRDKPGLEKRFVLEGWTIEESYFSTQSTFYNTSFGVFDFERPIESHELCFNVSLRRIVTTPLLTHGVAPSVVFVLVFVTFLMFSADRERRGHFGLTWSGVIGVWSGSLFATLIAQATLRAQLKAAGLAYLEVLHTLLYPTLVTVACIATLCVAAPGIRLLSWRDNLLAKLLYWPAVMTILLIVTFIVF